jgi:gliding motility-associated-like protein
LYTLLNKSIELGRGLLLVSVLLLFIGERANATHLMGGELTYTYDGDVTGGAFYTVKLIVYRYCDQTGGNTAALDQEMNLGIYTNDPGNPAGSLTWYNTEILILNGSTFVTATPNPNCPFQPTACIERGEYYATVLLPENLEGYHLLVERCCRNGNIINLDNPGSAGMSYYAFIPPGIINSSPQISDISVPYICSGDTISIINNAFDPDGDSLSYAFVTPYNGLSGQSNPVPDPSNSNPYDMPIVDVIYAPGYSQANVFGAGGYSYINPITGLTKYYIPNQGFYVAAIEIKEFRNGVLLSTIRRDLQFITIVCTPNAVPVISAAGQGGVYSVPEGQQLCFNVTFADADGDSLFLVPSGPLLDPLLTSPPGILPAASGNGIVTSQFCWTPVCGMSRPAAYQFSVTVTDNGCPQKTSSQVFSVYVTAGVGALTPTVSVLQTPAGVLCTGSATTYHANATLAGSNPYYFWYQNGVLQTTHDSLFTPAVVNNGDQITVTLVSSASCLLNDTAFSPPFVANVIAQPAPQVTITSNPSGNLCPQQICLFTATGVNGGATPAYQWNINGTQSGTNQPLFTAANPSGVMAVYVTLTPSTGCPPQQSNSIIFNIQPRLSPEIALTATVVDSICPGQPVAFTVTSALTGTIPIYEWFVNGIAQGINADSFNVANLLNGDVVAVYVTSNYPCLFPKYTYADPLSFYHYPTLTADLTDGPIDVCLGLAVNLLMSAEGGQSGTYNYSWSNGISATNENIFIPVTSGYYFSTIKDNCSNQITDSIYINVLPVPQTDFIWSPVTPSIFNPNVEFTDRSIDAVFWNWSLGEQAFSSEQNPAHEYATSGIFPIQLITTNDVGCTDTLIKNLEIENYITTYIPNSFTPNGDGVNEEFGLTGFSTGGYSMIIFNRWGEEVFVSSGPNDSWNGKNKKGKDAPTGIYTYLFKINNDKTQKPISGTVTLVR